MAEQQVQCETEEEPVEEPVEEEENEEHTVDEESNNPEDDNNDDDNEDNDEGDDEDYEDYEDYEEDEDITQPYNLFLSQLLEAQKKDLQKRKQTRFLPLTKAFLSASFVKKEKLLNAHPILINHLRYLCKQIVEGKIPVGISGADKSQLELIADKRTPRTDVRLHLLEEFRVQYYCREAIKLCEQYGGCEKTNTNGHRKVQQTNDAYGTTDKPTQSTQRRNANTDRRRTTR